MSSVGVQADPRPAAEAAARTDEFDEIIYHITHDVRSTLRALRTLPGWLREDLSASGQTPSTSVLEILEMIESQAERADTILLDLRTFSRIGRLHDAPTLVDLREVVGEAARRTNLPDSFRLELELGVQTLRGARNECVELFSALLSNAVKHHDEDRGRILIQSMVEDGAARINVDDDGPGIPERFRERVFAMMATLRARDECPGSGLGLSIARKIVRRMGGSIAVEDTDHGRGARIAIRLPADAPVLN